jgi:hypothetical protein
MYDCYSVCYRYHNHRWADRPFFSCLLPSYHPALIVSCHFLVVQWSLCSKRAMFSVKSSERMRNGSSLRCGSIIYRIVAWLLSRSGIWLWDWPRSSRFWRLLTGTLLLNLLSIWLYGWLWARLKPWNSLMIDDIRLSDTNRDLGQFHSDLGIQRLESLSRLPSL